MKNLDECNEILEVGFPTDESILKVMPFGEKMLEAFNKPNPKPPKNSTDPNDKYLHRKHLKKVVDSMNLLLKSNVRAIIRDSDRNEKVVADLTEAWYEIHGKENIICPEDQKIWRIEAFLHDVGKSLTYSKHPSRGEYLVTRLETDQKDECIKMLGENDKKRGENRFNQIKKVIGFHDRFGVLSTGEASYGILSDILEIGSREIDVEKALEVISHIMFVNLVDIDASIPSGLDSKKAEIVLKDWKRTCWNKNSPLKKSNGDHKKFERLLLELAVKGGWTINRIARLLNASYLRAREEVKKKKQFVESKWPQFNPDDFYDPVREAMATNIGIHWDEFRWDFAHISKMDYFLYMTDKIVKVNWEKNHSKEDIADIIVKVIIKLTDQFTNLIRQPDKRIRVGIDLSVLRDTPEVQEQIAILLSGNAKESAIGLDWLVNEASAWPFIK